MSFKIYHEKNVLFYLLPIGRGRDPNWKLQLEFVFIFEAFPYPTVCHLNHRGEYLEIVSSAHAQCTTFH